MFSSFFCLSLSLFFELILQEYCVINQLIMAKNNNDNSDVIYLSSDTDPDNASIKDDDNSMDDSASAKQWNEMFGDGEEDKEMEESDNENYAATNKCGSEYSYDGDDDDSYMSVEDEDNDDTPYERGTVSPEDILAAMEWAEANKANAANYIYSQIEKLLKNKTVIQFQIYGGGDLNEKEYGSLQLAVAFELLNLYKQKFPDISITWQEPGTVEAEKKYIQSKNIRILETETFTSEHFNQASASANIPEPAFICYMIHGRDEMYAEFLEAHWNAELLSRCIFVGNDLNLYSNMENPFPKLIEFAKLRDSKPLKFDAESPAEVAFEFNHVYSISKENAEILINKFSK